MIVLIALFSNFATATTMTCPDMHPRCQIIVYNMLANENTWKCRMFCYSLLVTATIMINAKPTISPDTLHHDLPELVVGNGNGHTKIHSLSRSRIHWDLSDMANLPQVMGNADPVRYVQMLPGVQSNNDYDCGLHIYGCDNSHNLISVEGVPIYNASHLLGLFSTFNPTHYQQVHITKTATDAAFANRLGGEVEMALPTNAADSVNGSVTAGLISTQGTINVPVSRNSSLTLSARTSYVNLLYGYAMRNDGTQLRYNFGDVNATWIWHDNESNKVWIDCYWGGDKAWMQEDRYQAKLKLRWGNIMAAAHWQREINSSTRMRHTCYFTRFSNLLSLNYPAMDFSMPSRVAEWGYRGQWRQRNLSIGMDAAWRSIMPQSPQVSEGTNARNNTPERSLLVQEYSPYANLSFSPWHNAVVIAGLRTTLFIDDSKQCHWAAAPSLSLTMTRNKWQASVSAAMRHQFIFQAGFSQMGFPTEYWFPVDNNLPPQRAMSIAASVSYSLPWWDMKVTLESYYKRLRNIVEYNGTLLDFVNTVYNQNDHLLTGNGSNYGIGITVSRTQGRLTGWVTYNIGRALRKFNSGTLYGTFPAHHERIHELSALMSWNVSPRWTISGTFIFATGTPYTAVEHFYIYAGQIISHFGKHNADRLGNYSRLDLSATFRFARNGRREQGLNFSVYNTLANRNELFYAWRVTQSGEITYRPVSFVMKIMPSVSYYIKF